jgi:hypothetical protein
VSKLSTFILIATVASAASVLPAFAQAFDPDAGSGNIVPFNAAPPAPQITPMARPTDHAATAAREAGLHAFARVPGGRVGASAYDRR